MLFGHILMVMMTWYDYTFLHYIRKIMLKDIIDFGLCVEACLSKGNTASIVISVGSVTLKGASVVSERKLIFVKGKFFLPVAWVWRCTRQRTDAPILVNIWSFTMLSETNPLSDWFTPCKLQASVSSVTTRRQMPPLRLQYVRYPHKSNPDRRLELEMSDLYC